MEWHPPTSKVLITLIGCHLPPGWRMVGPDFGFLLSFFFLFYFSLFYFFVFSFLLIVFYRSFPEEIM